MTGGVVRRDGLREAVTKLRDEYALMDNVTVAVQPAQVADDLARVLDAVPDVPPTEAHRPGCSCHDVPRYLSSCTCFGPVVPPDPPVVGDEIDRLRGRVAALFMRGGGDPDEFWRWLNGERSRAAAGDVSDLERLLDDLADLEAEVARLQARLDHAWEAGDETAQRRMVEFAADYTTALRALVGDETPGTGEHA